MPRILVADDNTNIQRMVSLAFSSRGIEVVAVGNGEAAVRRLPEMNPDLVLADIFMPVRNGYEVCEYVKKDERFSHIPVILLVGAFDPLDEKEARRVGADGVLKKPFVPPDPLIAMVIAILEKNPRIAAELAKPKEAAVVAAAPPAMEQELPLKVMPKPLPEFPEPSPEDAALAYGFGSGRRTLEDDDQTGTSVALRDPLGETSDVDLEEGSAASQDWRRSARDFQVPEEAVNMPAFATDENFSTPTPLTAEPAVKLPEPEPAAPVLAAIPVAAAKVKEESVAASHAPESAEVSAEKIETPPTSRFGSKTAHWTEMMGSLPEYKKGGWFAAATSAVEESVRNVSETAIPESTPSSSHPDEVATGVNSELNADMSSGAPQKIEDAVTLSILDSAPLLPAEEKVAINFDNFKAATHTWSNPAPREAESALVAPESRQPSTDDLPLDSFFDAEVKEYEHNEAAEPEFSSQTASFGRDKEALEEEPEPVRTTASFVNNVSEGFGLDSAPSASPANGTTHTTFRDPNLVMPPAVHVTPEPLLVDDEPRVTSSAYGMKTQETAPLHSFEMPSDSETAPTETHEAEEIAARADRAEDSGFELRQSEIKAWSSMPRPTERELLAHIPYLTPPADINESPDPAVEDASPIASAARSEAPALDSTMVNAIAQRVLEALEPKLHELLSQGLLKPLVENILHDELEKKEK